MMQFDVKFICDQIRQKAKEKRKRKLSK